MANRFRQFRLLLWKNFILQIRRPIGTAFEILVPLVLIFGILVLPKLMKDAKKDDIYAETIESSQYNYNCFDTFEPQQLSREQLKKKSDEDDYYSEDERRTANKTLAFYPTGGPVASLMTKVSRTTGFKVTNKSVLHNGKTFKSLDDVISEVTEHNDNYMGAIVFDINEGKSKLPNKVKYTIRLTGDRWDKWNTGKTYPKKPGSGPRSYTMYKDIFVPIQYAVDMAIIQEKTNISSIIPLNLEQFPYPDYTTIFRPHIPEVGGLLPFLLTLTFIYTAMSIIKEIVFEKQNRLKESMKMMGLANWIHWAAWYIKCLLFLMISLVLITAMLKGFKIFENSNGFLLFLFFLFYAMSAISYCFFISVFFSNPTLSMLFGSVLWLASSLPFLIVRLQERFHLLDRSVVAGMCLLPNSALGIGARIFSRLEGMKIGVSFDNIDKPLLQSPEDTFTLARVMCMMLVSSVVFMILTWYIEGVFPGKYGISKPFYFPFLKSYWCGQSNDDLIEANSEEGKGDELLYHGHDVEDDPADMEVGVCIKNLRKVYKSSTGTKVAVDGLSLKIFKGQITALLGHNGAGKTTTISILTGLFSPTSGSAMIGNKSILTDIDAIRESLGLCPQHNVLFDRLTVKEHLEFFVNLKGKYGQAAKDEVMAMITDMQLLDKTNKNSSTLSGGMKRKLSCAIALIGGSETVFLDEPTSGMDPYARRATWDLLLKYKADKTIILTTHFMDEADFLGDRIAIMADGQLRCCGSSLFLKSRYGVGYHLTLVKKEDFDKNITMSAIKRVIPSVEILSNVGAELELILDRESATYFGSLFHELETNKEKYGIASFGVSVTTMEEVFMKVGEGSERTVENIARDQQRRRDTESLIEMPNDEEPEMGELLKGLPLKWQQYKAMFIKRFLNSKREKKAVVTQIILPLAMVLLGLMIMNAKPEWGSEPARVLKLSNLGTGGSNVVAFYADFRQTKTDIKVAKDFLKTSKVDMKDVSGDVEAIHLGNMGNSIKVKGKSYNYTVPINNKTSTACCDYQFFILNKKCKSDFINESLLHYTCYKKRKNKNRDTWCPYYMRKADLDDMNVYFSEYVLEKSNTKDFFKKHVAGFTFGPPPTIKNVTTSNNVTNTTKSVVVMPDTMSTVWYSNKAYHTIAEALNAMSNILLRQHSRVDDLIETINHPLPDKTEDRIEEDEGSAMVRVILLSFLLAMGLAFMAASFITFLVKERSSKAKHLQFVSGVDAVCYWLATYTWDYINYMIPAIFVLILIAAFQLDEFKDDLGTVLLLLLLFGFCALPFVYCLSFVFTSPLIAYALTVFILSILSLVMLNVVFVTRWSNSEDADILHHVFMLFPTYTLSISFNDMATNYRHRKTCTENVKATEACKFKKILFTTKPLDWDMPGVGQEALFMFVEGLVLFTLTILIQVRFLVGTASKLKNEVNADINRNEDEDVRTERERVLGLDKENIDKESVVIKNLTKVYRGSDRIAVDHLSIGIPRGECFGLLGVNGAGKTTTFSMLTGDQSITEGSAYLDGYNLQTQLRQVQQRIGYCPQFDALIERMTGREMLKMYAQLRGVHPSKIDDIVSSTINKLQLGEWADKLSGNYSGGNKRKLSTAIALVGDPPIVFLDEPTSGMDPVSRRFLWNALYNVMKGGRSIVLTSHSMEECEALCTRLAIMVNGQFKCVGSPQHLKNRFGTGYTLTIKVKGSSHAIVPEASENNPPAPQQQNTTPVAFVPVLSDGAQQQELPMVADAVAVSKAKSFIEETFQGAVLMETHSGMLTYHIINEDLTWSQIFGNLERNREMLGIVDYSVSQTTLDQVFINFAKKQHSEERRKVKRKCGCLPCC